MLSLVFPAYYYRALYATMASYAVNAIQNNGKPQLNMYYAQRVMQDQSVMIAIYAAIFLMGNPVFVFLSPLLLRSLWMGTYLMNGLLSAKIPSLHQRVRPLFQKVLTRMGWFNQTIAWLEAMVGIFLVFACFFMSRTVLLTFIYWQIMHARYMMDYQIRAAFTRIHAKIQSVLSRIPFLLNLYLKLSGYLGQMVDPQRLQEQMQGGAGTGAAGMAAGLMKKCSIM